MPEFVRELLINPQNPPDRSRFPFTLPIFKNFEALAFDPKVTFLVGENGSGKSTLMEALAVKTGMNAEGGPMSASFETWATHSDMHEHLVYSRGDRFGAGFFLRGETLYNVLTNSQHADPPGPLSRLHRASHGEAFIGIVEGMIQNGLYLMDEPESALSPQRQLAFLAHMKRLVDLDCQLIIATHSPILLAYPEALIYHLSEDGIVPVGYEDTEHFRITRDFLNHREAFLRHLV